MARGYWFATIAFTLIAADAYGGVIRGRVRVGGGIASAEGAAAVSFAPQDVVVWVDSLPLKAQRRHQRKGLRVSIEQSRRRFTPRVTAVSAGTKVRFRNRDQVYHNVFSVSPTKKFDLGKYAPRDVNPITFDQPGVVNLYCDIHPGEEAYILVLPHAAFARPTRRGIFALPDLPPGVYEMRCWHPTLGTRSRKVTVPLRGDVAVTLGY